MNENVIKNNGCKTDLDVVNFRNILLNSNKEAIKALRKIGKFDHHNSDVTFNEDLTIFLYSEVGSKFVSFFFFLEDKHFVIDIELSEEEDIYTHDFQTDERYENGNISVAIYINQYQHFQGKLIHFTFNIDEVISLYNDRGIELAKEYLHDCVDASNEDVYNIYVDEIVVNENRIFLASEPARGIIELTPIKLGFKLVNAICTFDVPVVSLLRNTNVEDFTYVTSLTKPGGNDYIVLKKSEKEILTSLKLPFTLNDDTSLYTYLVDRYSENKEVIILRTDHSSVYELTEQNILNNLRHYSFSFKT